MWPTFQSSFLGARCGGRSDLSWNPSPQAENLLACPEELELFKHRVTSLSGFGGQSISACLSFPPSPHAPTPSRIRHTQLGFQSSPGRVGSPMHKRSSYVLSMARRPGDLMPGCWSCWSLLCLCDLRMSCLSRAVVSTPAKKGLRHPKCVHVKAWHTVNHGGPACCGF